MTPDPAIIKTALGCRCPRCQRGALYESRFSLTLRAVCPDCGLDFSKNDSADGPAVFLIFILGALLVPLAIAVEFAFSPPAWFHAVFWIFVCFFLTVVVLKPLKAYVIALQYKHRPGDWE